jgi:hypothetical protein
MLYVLFPRKNEPKKKKIQDLLHFKRNGKEPVRQKVRSKIVSKLILRKFCLSFNTNQFLFISNGEDPFPFEFNTT